MRVLVSVSDANEARAALDAGADIIDAKDPGAGALGAVSTGTLRAIHAVVNGARPVSVALGDAIDEREVEDASREAAAVLGIAVPTARQWWAYARAWLRVELSGTSGGSTSVAGSPESG